MSRRRRPNRRASATGAFNPKRFGGGTMTLWLRADLGISLNGGNVSAWADQSGAGHHVSQGTAANQPLFVANSKNGRPGVRFDGAGDFLKATAFTTAQPLTHVMAYKMITNGVSAVNDGLFDGDTFGTFFGLSDTTPHLLVTSDSGGNFIQTTFTPCNGIFDSVVAKFNGASSFIRVHKVQQASGNAGVVSSLGFTLGALANGTRSVNVEVLEWMIYAASLSAADIDALEGYLFSRYAL